MSIKKTFYIILLLTSLSPLLASNPLSKITIKSQIATCYKNDKTNKIECTYEKKVAVTLADKSSITADRLEIFLDAALSKKQTTTSTQKKSPVEKITFSNNVRVTKNERTATADRMQIFPDKQECHLYGNVVICQRQKKKSQVPIITKGDHAILNLKTQRITIVGSDDAPVNTTLFFSKRIV